MIELKAINKWYQLGTHHMQVLHDVSLTIDKGEFVSIMGPSGSGKSTLVNVLGFLDANYDGEYYFNHQSMMSQNDRDISKLRNQMVGFVYQSFNLIETITVADNVRLPLLYNGYSIRQTNQKVTESLEKVGLGSKLNSMPSQLSGGQKQRVAIARALVNTPQFIIADEPTGALDTKTSQMIMTTLERLNREDGVTIVMVTHDPALEGYSNRRIRVVDGQVVSNIKLSDEDYKAGKKDYTPIEFSRDESDERLLQESLERTHKKKSIIARITKRGGRLS